MLESNGGSYWYPGRSMKYYRRSRCLQIPAFVSDPTMLESKQMQKNIKYEAVKNPVSMESKTF